MYFIFLMVACLKLVISQTRVYSIYPIFDQKMLTGHLLAEVDADSLSVCSAMCRNDCSCFGFNPQIKSCRLHKFCDLANMSPAESAWRYYYSSGAPLGCFEDFYPSRMLKSPAHNPVPNGRTQCCVSCTKQDKYKFFGLEAGFECFCGNEMNKIYKLRPRRECNMTCVGNVQETCGGLWRIEMFSLQ